MQWRRRACTVLRAYGGNLRVRVSPAEHRRLVVEAQKQGASLNRFRGSILAARGQR
ncbi:toxin-antitoxin system HicB family antitoxin [Paeniglutamicibacter sulfureus]|uniref:toxin-antitoxin system HicB family antitoxin n=1 Tax=Paeniglutamicibacter sulfureus TaxID=43666 RepID=UPI0031DA369E